MVESGAAGVKDTAGNALAADHTWTFSVVGCPCSLFVPSAQPDIPSSWDGGAVEVGMRFRADVAGTVSALRFYKGIYNFGTHIGSLWTNDGTLLGRATYTNETESGWQTVTLATPVAISAGMTYIVSYHAPNGRYAVTTNGFGSEIANAPLRGLADGVAGRQRRLPLRRESGLPGRHVAREQLLGGRRVHAVALAGRGDSAGPKSTPKRSRRRLRRCAGGCSVARLPPDAPHLVEFRPRRAASGR